MATFVLVHGANLGGWCYQRVSRLLRRSGHEVHTPTLTGLGERAHLMNPSISLDTHIEDVLGLIKDQSVTMRDPQQLSEHLDGLVKDVEQTEETEQAA